MSHTNTVEAQYLRYFCFHLFFRNFFSTGKPDEWQINLVQAACRVTFFTRHIIVYSSDALNIENTSSTSNSNSIE